MSSRQGGTVISQEINHRHLQDSIYTALCYRIKSPLKDEGPSLSKSSTNTQILESIIKLHLKINQVPSNSWYYCEKMTK